MSKDYIYGRKPVIEALLSESVFIQKIQLYQNAIGEEIKQIKKSAIEQNIRIQTVPNEALSRITRKSHQGVIAYITPVPFYNLEDVLMQVYDKGEDPLFLLLDGITDVRNFGAIIRTALGTGVHSIIIPEDGSARINEVTVKSSAGAIHHLPICKVKSLESAIKYLKLNGIRILSSGLSTKKSLNSVDLKLPVSIVIGSEDKGVSRKIESLADELFSIPIKSKLDSYNVSVATGMILYETMTQRSETD